MSDDYTEIVEWLLDLSSRLDAPGLENAADVIERLSAELAAAEADGGRLIELSKANVRRLEEARVENAKLREALEPLKDVALLSSDKDNHFVLVKAGVVRCALTVLAETEDNA